MKDTKTFWRAVQSPAFMWIVLGILLVVLILVGLHPWWRGHLAADIGTFHARANHFLSGHSWAGMGYNEYQPGALWFFVLLASITPNPGNYDAFLTSTMLVNAGLIAMHLAYFRQYGNRYASLLFLGLVVTAGPILLYRFELLVSVLTLYAWTLFQKDRPGPAALLLGIATSIKLYPVVLMSLLLMPGLARRDWREMLRVILWFSIGMLTPVVFAVEYGLPFQGMLESIHVHQLKPVGLEGFWGNAITIAQSIAGVPLRVTPGYGVHGLTSDLPYMTDTVLNNIWMIPTGAALVWIFHKGRKRGFTDPGFAYLVLFIFLFFSKVVNPQYLWWALCFIPLIPLTWLGKELRGLVIVAAMGGLLLTQIVYPVYYTEFLEWFGGSVASPRIFSIMAIRTVLLLFVLCVAASRLLHLPQPKK